MKFNNKELSTQLHSQIESRMAGIAEGKSAHDIAVEIYMTLPDKSPTISSMMVDEMVAVIERYHTDIDKCLTDETDFINDTLDEATQNAQTPLDRCLIYHRILIALAAHAIYSGGGEGAEEKAKQYLADHSDLTMTAEEAAARETELHDLAVDALSSSELFAAQLPAFLHSVQSCSYTPVSGYPVPGRGSADLKLLLCMQAYVNAQNGQYEDLPPETTLEQIVYNVCGTVDTCAVAAGIESGEIKKPFAIRLLHSIGVVLGALAAQLVHIIAGAMVVLLLFFHPFWAITITALSIGYGAAEGARTAAEYHEKCGAAFERIGCCIGTTAEYIWNGLKKLCDWFIPYIASAAQWLKANVYSRIPKPEASPERTIMPDTAATPAKPNPAETASNASITDTATESPAHPDPVPAVCNTVPA